MFVKYLHIKKEVIEKCLYIMCCARTIYKIFLCHVCEGNNRKESLYYILCKNIFYIFTKRLTLKHLYNSFCKEAVLLKVS